MGFIEVFFIGIGLAMDASAVSMTNALCDKTAGLKKIFITALCFGFFQALMPTIGFFAGSTFAEYISAYDHWVAFILLSLIGGKMIYEASKKEEDEEEKCFVITYRLLAVQAVATSIDALAVGVSFSLIENSGNRIFQAAGIIGAVTLLCCIAASYIGKKFGTLLKRKAEFFGGFILILIGLKILTEHLLGL